MKLSDSEIKERLENLPGWDYTDGAICKTFEFDGFMKAMAFMNLAAPVAEEMQHHPEWTNIYNRVEVRLTTHDEGGVTERDFELAEAMERFSGQDAE